GAEGALGGGGGAASAETVGDARTAVAALRPELADLDRRLHEQADAVAAAAALASEARQGAAALASEAREGAAEELAAVQGTVAGLTAELARLRARVEEPPPYSRRIDDVAAGVGQVEQRLEEIVRQQDAQGDVATHALARATEAGHRAERALRFTVEAMGPLQDEVRVLREATARQQDAQRDVAAEALARATEAGDQA